jgi:hypothetical protein
MALDIPIGIIQQDDGGARSMFSRSYSHGTLFAMTVAGGIARNEY